MLNISVFKKEWVVITIGWVLIYASSPLYMYYATFAIDSYFDWKEVCDGWAYLSAFLFLFLLNHYILIPKLVVNKHFRSYVLCVLVVAILFTLFLQMVSPRFRPKDAPPMERPNREVRAIDRDDAPIVTQVREREHERDDKRAPWLAPPDLARLVIALLMMAVDLGIVAWFNEEKMRQRVLLLEQQNLKQELEHLRYQINPHFFMNTLNNIHVLVDVDREQAQKAIVELSRLMRYALYTGSGSMVQLDKEVEFIQLYISLMKLRYCDKVEIQCRMPEGSFSDVQIPPLLLATFVENAFKHGVSYQHHSFIYVTLSVEENRQICFQCVNSRHARTNVPVDEHHGIGLSNVKKRLDLQYGKQYSLIIDDHSEDQFLVSLELPTTI